MRDTFSHSLSAFPFAKRCDISLLDLQRFSEEAAATADATASPAANAAHTAEESPAAGADKQAAFEELIRGEYKQEFARRTQSILDKRFRQAKALEAQAAQYAPLAGALAQRYGVDASDLSALLRAVQEDRSAPPPAPAPASASDDQTEQAAVEGQAAVRRVQGALRLYERWRAEGEELKQTYPDFDLEAEAQNPDLARLLQCGVSLRTAYQAIHQAELLGGAMHYAAQRAAAAAAEEAARRASRPAENGTLPHAGAVFRPDVAGMTPQQRAALERRAARGEKILF